MIARDAIFTANKHHFGFWLFKKKSIFLCRENSEHMGMIRQMTLILKTITKQMCHISQERRYLYLQVYKNIFFQPVKQRNIKSEPSHMASVYQVTSAHRYYNFSRESCTKSNQNYIINYQPNLKKIGM